MPTANLGRVGIVNKGNYVGSTTPYKINDIVKYNNSVYICIQAHSVEHLPTDVVYWQVWVDTANYYVKSEVDALILTEIGAPIASASTTAIGGTGAGDIIHITGVTTITSFGASVTGTVRTLVFDGILTVTHNGTSMILPNSADMLTVAGSSIEIICENGALGYWRCTKVMHNDVSMAELSYISTLTSDVQTQLNGKQPTLTIDAVPTDASANPVQSNGVFDALALKAATADVLAKAGGTMTGAITALQEVKVTMGTAVINLALGNSFAYTVTGATTFSIINAQALPSTNGFNLRITNGGSAVITWFSGAKWSGGTLPTMTASGVDKFAFESPDGGTTWEPPAGKDIK